jgi:hypothetical protein
MQTPEFKPQYHQKKEGEKKPCCLDPLDTATDE